MRERCTSTAEGSPTLQHHAKAHEHDENTQPCSCACRPAWRHAGAALSVRAQCAGATSHPAAAAEDAQPSAAAVTRQQPRTLNSTTLPDCFFFDGRSAALGAVQAAAQAAQSACWPATTGPHLTTSPGLGTPPNARHVTPGPVRLNSTRCAPITLLQCCAITSNKRARAPAWQQPPAPRASPQCRTNRRATASRLPQTLCRLKAVRQAHCRRRQGNDSAGKEPRPAAARQRTRLPPPGRRRAQMCVACGAGAAAAAPAGPGL